MTFGITVKQIAAAFALCGFAVAVIAGLGAGNSAGQVLTTAILCMFVCQFAGLGAGLIGERVINERLAAYRAASAQNPPAPDSSRKSSPPDAQNS